MKIHGVFIGINVHKDDRINDLQFAERDAMQFHLLLSKNFMEDERNFYLLTGVEATKINILKILGDHLPSVVKEDDLVVIFFAGHGSTEIKRGIDDAARYLVMYDTEFDYIYSTGINMEFEIKQLLERIHSKFILVILDSCFSGMGGGRTFEGPKINSYRTGWRNSIQLSELNLGEGRMIISACDSDEVARESFDLRQGIFTHFLLKNLQKKPNSENSISILELASQIYRNVTEYTDYNQHPVFNGRVRGASFPLLNND